MTRLVFPILLAFLLCSCDVLFPEAGNLDQPCTAGGACVSGLECVDGRCINPDAVDGDHEFNPDGDDPSDGDESDGDIPPDGDIDDPSDGDEDSIDGDIPPDGDADESADGDEEAIPDGDESEADPDIEEDNDTDTVCTCTTGPCCDGCNFRLSSYACNDNLDTDYQCAGSACGDDAQKKTQVMNCSGVSADCNGTTSWGDWTMHANCGSDEKCGSDNETYASCTYNASCTCECSSGVCCDGCSYYGPDHACETDADYVYGCPNGTACGEDVGIRYRDRMCSGSGTACDGSLGAWKSWGTADACGASEYCSPGMAACQTADSEDSFSCYSGDVYWYDSCGVRETKKTECGNCTCSGSSCVDDNQYSSSCYSGDVWWYDCSGNRETKKEECNNCACSGSACTVNNQYSSQCYDNDVYWYDCHGVRKTKKAECGAPGCSGGACVTTTPGFVSITAGTFWMGSPNDDSPCPAGYPPGDCTAELGRIDGREKLHEVTLTYDFELMAHEITQGEWVSLMTWNPSYFPSCGSDCPVEQVSWFDVLAYANELSAAASLTPCYVFSSVTCEDGSTHGSDYMACMNSTQGGIDSATVTLAGGASKAQDCEGYRLPTEAEWEYAIRSGSEYTAFYTSAGNNGVITQTARDPRDPNLDQIGWYGGNSGVSYAGGYNCSGWYSGSTTCGTHPVGEKEENAWGLYDMSGNVYEWVWDWYQESYENDVATDPTGPSTPGSNRVLRGGGWNGYARNCRSAFRYYASPGSRGNYLGARLSRSLP